MEHDEGAYLVLTTPKEDRAEVASSELNEYLEACRKVSPRPPVCNVLTDSHLLLIVQVHVYAHEHI